MLVGAGTFGWSIGGCVFGSIFGEMVMGRVLGTILLYSGGSGFGFERAGVYIWGWPPLYDSGDFHCAVLDRLFSFDTPFPSHRPKDGV